MLPSVEVQRALFSHSGHCVAIMDNYNLTSQFVVFLRLHKGTEARDSLLTAQMSVVLPDCVFYCMWILGYCCGNARYYISLPHEGVDALAWAAWSSCGCPSPAVSQARLDGV